MNSRIIKKNNPADQEIGFLTKSISNTYGRATVMPLAWELRNPSLSYYLIKRKKIIRFFSGIMVYTEKKLL